MRHRKRRCLRRLNARRQTPNFKLGHRQIFHAEEAFFHADEGLFRTVKTLLHKEERFYRMEKRLFHKEQEFFRMEKKLFHVEEEFFRMEERWLRTEPGFFRAEKSRLQLERGHFPMEKTPARSAADSVTGNRGISSRTFRRASMPWPRRLHASFPNSVWERGRKWFAPQRREDRRAVTAASNPGTRKKPSIARKAIAVFSPLSESGTPGVRECKKLSCQFDLKFCAIVGNGRFQDYRNGAESRFAQVCKSKQR